MVACQTHSRIHTLTHLCACTDTHTAVLTQRPPSLYEWRRGCPCVWLIKSYLSNHMLLQLCKYGVLNDTVSLLLTFNSTVYIISALKTWGFSTWGTPTPLLLDPLCAICHHSQHKLVKPPRLKLSPEHCSTNWHKCKHKIWARKHTRTHWMLTDEFLFLAVFSLCWQFRHILPMRKRSCTHAHIYIENMYTHPDTHIYSDLLPAE